MATTLFPERGYAAALPFRQSQRQQQADAPDVARARRGDEPAREPDARLSVSCDEQEDMVVVSLAGDLDIYTTPGFQEHVRRYDPAETRLVIDLSEVGLLDAAGLGALVSLRDRAHREGARLGLVCPDRRLMRLFWFTGLRHAFRFEDDVPGAGSAPVEEAGRLDPDRQGALIGSSRAEA